MLLHAPDQLHFLGIELAQLAQTLQVALGHLEPALAAAWGAAGIGAVKNGVSRRGRGREIRLQQAVGADLAALQPARAGATGMRCHEIYKINLFDLWKRLG